MSNFEKKIDEAAEYFRWRAQQQKDKRRTARRRIKSTTPCTACFATGLSPWGLGPCARCHGRGRVGGGVAR